MIHSRGIGSQAALALTRRSALLWETLIHGEDGAEPFNPHTAKDAAHERFVEAELASILQAILHFLRRILHVAPPARCILCGSLT